MTHNHTIESEFWTGSLPKCTKSSHRPFQKWHSVKLEIPAVFFICLFCLFPYSQVSNMKYQQWQQHSTQVETEVPENTQQAIQKHFEELILRCLRIWNLSHLLSQSV